MKIKSIAIVSVFTAILASNAPAKPEQGSDELKIGTGAWAFTVDESLPNVLIIGDSISIGYTISVRKELAGKANVFRPMAREGKGPENSAGTTNGVKKIDGWLKGRKWDVIHFNFGLHDLKHVNPKNGGNSSKASDPYQADMEQYAKNLEEIVGKMEKTGAKLIFVTTTPVAPGTTNPLREVDGPVRYNKAALEIMKKHNIEVNDLFTSVSTDLEKVQLPKNVHFNKDGNALMSKQVAGAISGALPTGEGGKKP